MVGKDARHKAMLASVEESLENLAYLPVEEEKEHCPSPTGARWWAWLEITSPGKGAMLVEASRSLVEEVANMIFDEDSCTDEICNDVTAELVNTLAGRFMAKVLDESESEFQMGLPTSGQGTAPEFPDAADQLIFVADAHCFRVSIYGKDFQ